MRASEAPLYGAAGNTGAAGLVTGAGVAAAQNELGSARNPVYMMQVPFSCLGSPFCIRQDIAKCWSRFEAGYCCYSGANNSCSFGVFYGVFYVLSRRQ